ncbi:MAG: hypothetical protein HY963_07940 [Ignavibacteriales bacterium]|nr:hypothetical protein [Ignavibacteriales bacterium]
MAFNFDNNLLEIRDSDYFLEDKLLWEIKFRRVLMELPKEKNIIAILTNSIHIINKDVSRFNQAERISNFFNVVKDLASKVGESISEERIEHSKKLEFVIAPRLIDSFHKSKGSLLDNFFSQLLNERYESLKLWKLQYEDDDRYGLYADMILIDKNGRVILVEIKVDARYNIDQYLNYLRIYKNALGYGYTNIKHVLISKRSINKPLTKNQMHWIENIEDGSKTLIMNDKLVLKYIQDIPQKSRKGDIRRLLSQTDLKHEDIINFKIYFRNYLDLDECAKNLNNIIEFPDYLEKNLSDIRNILMPSKSH